MIPELSVGIDYHKDSLQVCVMEKSGRIVTNRRIGNSIEEILSVVGSRVEDVVVTAEACCGTASLLDSLHDRTGWKVKLCHPGYAQRMRNNPDKSDKSDGELIADLTRIGYLPEVYLAPAEIRDLRALVRYRALEMKEARNAKLRIRALLRNNRISLPAGLSLWTISGLKWLQTDTGLSGHSAWIMSRYLEELKRRGEEVKTVTVRLQQFVKQDSVSSLLLKQRGIGVVTAAVMRAEIGTFTRFKTGKQLARFCGLSPCNRSSGTVVADSGVIRAGNPVLKSCITQGVWTLIRHDPRWKEFYQTLVQKGKPKGLAASAVANRWMRKLFHDLKNY